MSGLARTISHFLAIFFLVVANGSSMAIESVSSSWKIDCAGRMQISFPGEVDIAAETVTGWSKRGARVGKFPGEQTAPWSSLYYFGELKISHTWSDQELSERLQDYQRSRDKFRPDGEIQKKFGAKTFSELSTLPLHGVGWQFGETFYAILRVGQHLIDWTTTVDQINKDSYPNLINGLRPRPTFDVPKDPGVCLPYLFVKDDGTPPRHIGMTYRLKDHPDITIWLEDASAATVGENQDPEKFSAKYKAFFFWTQRYQDRNGMRSLLPLEKNYLPTTFAGQKGVKTFIELTRRDGVTRDFGYLIAVRGDPEAKEDKPDLMFYVIQDSLNARKRGIEPLDKKAFLHLAETIAASVKRREVTH